MPGIVLFKRRWGVGSDDLVVPGMLLAIFHLIWVAVLAVILIVVPFDHDCSGTLKHHIYGFLSILILCVILEIAIVCVSMRGSILDDSPRTSMQYIIYARLVVFLGEVVWLVLGVIWILQNYKTCPASHAKKAILGILIFNWFILLLVLITSYCTFDSAGRSWVKMRRYQQSIRTREPAPGQRRRSGSRRRNWRQRKATRAYEQSWHRRCRFLFCCVKEDRHGNSFTEVAQLFTEFFRDLDVVPSDVVAGLVLLRNQQKLNRRIVIQQRNNTTHSFLSGVPINDESEFLSSREDEEDPRDLRRVKHYMRYALAAYGWPMYFKMSPGTGLCNIMPHLKCCSCWCNCGRQEQVIDDNCCGCNVAALKKLLGLKDVVLVYATYHVDIGETPFYVAVDHSRKTVVVSIRGTLSFHDVLTDLKAESEQLPLDPPREDWLGHKGMKEAAVYIKKQLRDKQVLQNAFSLDIERGTQDYDLILVGHSLGAGTAAILAILLHQDYPNLHCYSYSPPGGLISAEVVKETKSYITSVVVGKDVVPRIGLHQLEALRADLINVIKKSGKPKWKTIGSGMACCKGASDDEQLPENCDDYIIEKKSRCYTHPNDSDIQLTSHKPLYPPGRIIQVVRNHPKESKRLFGRPSPVYQALWVDNTDFDEVIISPTMLQDHMPDNVMDALEKVLINLGPTKPQRSVPPSQRKALLSHEDSQFMDRSVFLESSIDEPSVFTSNAENSQQILFSLANEKSIEPEVIQGYSMQSDPHSLSWDYSRTTHPGDADMVSDVNMPLLVHKLESVKPKMMLDIPQQLLPAPLASPETLSETSSIESDSRRSTFQRVTEPPSLDPIQQSPVQGNSPFNTSRSFTGSTPSLQDLHSSLLVAPGTPLAASTPHKFLDDHSPDDHSPPKSYSPEAKQCLQMNDPADKSASTLIDLDLNPLPDNMECPNMQKSAVQKTLLNSIPSLNLTEEEEKLKGKLSKMQSPEHYRVTFGEESIMNESDPYTMHSSDSPCQQVPCDPAIKHYSSAERGYHHGAFSPQNPLSDDFVPELQKEIFTSTDDNPAIASMTIQNDNLLNSHKSVHNNGGLVPDIECAQSSEFESSPTNNMEQIQSKQEVLNELFSDDNKERFQFPESVV